jgi:hypothetical protein
LRINGKTRTTNIHRLVAKSFIKNDDKTKIVVNHKDGNKLNNNVSNLEWCTYKENTQHALKNNLAKKNCKRVDKLTMDGKFIKTYDSIKSAEEDTGVSNKHISTVCRGKRKSTGGFKWRYTDEKFNEVTNVQGKEIEGFPNYLITKDKKIYSKRLRSYMKLKKMDSGYLTIKLCNNKVSKDFYIRKLYKKYYGETKL